MKYAKLIILFLLLNSVNTFSQFNTEKLNEQIYTEVDFHNIPNLSVAVCNSDSIIYRYDFGSFEADNYLLGSMSKSFTGLAILKLYQQNLIDLNQSVRFYLSWFDDINIKNASSVTINQLLTHTSGIKRKIGLYNPDNRTNIIEFYTEILNKVPIEINKKYEYSNLNYQLIALIIEQISGISYSDFIEKNIFNQYNMSGSAANYNQTQTFDLVNSYQHYFTIPIKSKVKQYNDNIVSSGFISSNSVDMCSYLQFFLKSFSSDTSKNVENDTKTIKNIFEKSGNYCCGWEKKEKFDATIYKHDGLTQSFASSMCFISEYDLGIIVLSNVNNSPSTQIILDKILRNYLNKEQVEYSRTGFYSNIALLFFDFWLVILLVIRLIKLKRKGFIQNLNKGLWSYIKLISAFVFSIVWF